MTRTSLLLAVLAACSDPPCEGSVKLTFPLQLTLDQLSGATVQVCFDQRCGTATFSAIDRVADPAASLDVAGGFACTVELTHDSSLVMLDVGGTGTHHSNDVYTVNLTGADGAGLFGIVAYPTYTEHSSGGATCRSADLVIISTP